MWTQDSSAHLAKSLLTLYTQVNALAPQRDTQGGPDGSLGDASHAARKSGHNPDENHIVKAMDLTHDPVHFFALNFAVFLRTHPDKRLQYIISNGRICNGDIQNWAWRPYSGTNPHNHHIHIEVRSSLSLCDDPSNWNLAGWSNTASPNATPSVSSQFPRIHLGDIGTAVDLLQNKLHVPLSHKFDEPTEKELVYFQFKNQLEVDGWVGPNTWSKLGAFVEFQADTQHTNKNIIATEFGGAGDANKSAYDEHTITDTEIGASLPMRFAQPTPLLWVRGPNGVLVENVPLVDVGPIYPAAARGPADPYWETGARPRAETNKVLSQAGIDLTPALAKRLNLNGKGLVDWGFMQTVVSSETPQDNELLLIIAAIVLDQETTMDDKLRALLLQALNSKTPDPNLKALLLQALGGAGTQPPVIVPPPPPTQGLDLLKFLPLLQSPVIVKLLGGKPVTTAELLPLIKQAMEIFTGKSIPLGDGTLPPPVTTPPASGTVLPGVTTGLTISGLIALLMDSGILGTPFNTGQMPTTTGTLGAIIAGIAPLLGAAGGFSPILGAIGSVLGNLFGKLGNKLTPSAVLLAIGLSLAMPFAEAATSTSNPTDWVERLKQWLWPHTTITVPSPEPPIVVIPRLPLPPTGVGNKTAYPMLKAPVIVKVPKAPQKRIVPTQKAQVKTDCTSCWALAITSREKVFAEGKKRGYSDAEIRWWIGCCQRKSA